MYDYDITIAEAEIGPCPVCGAPNSTCKGESDYHGSVILLPRQKHDPRATFRVPHRVYEETTVGTRKVRKLLYSKGDAITPAEAKRLGFLPNDAPTKRPR